MIRKFLIFILLISFSYAEDVRTVVNVNLTVTDEGTIRAIGGSLRYVAVNITAAQQKDYQQAVYSSPIIFDENGNSLISLVDSRPANPFVYSTRTEVSTKNRVTTALSPSYQIPQEFLRYAKATPRIQSDYPAIKELARKITANSTSDFEKVAKLAIWVNGYVNYNLSTSGKWYDAEWVLGNKEGVCIEYTTLFAAMARSLGIPTRVIIGYAYDDKENAWIGHAWNEVYLGKWVPVDATWLEVGQVDAVHIETGRYLDNETLSATNAYALVTQNAVLDWTPTAGADPTKRANVVMEGIAYKEKESSYDFIQGATELGFGGSSVVYATIYPRDYRVAHLELSACDIIDVKETERDIILEPEKTKVVSWIVSTNKNLQSGYIYTCSVGVGSDYLKEKDISFRVYEDAKKIYFDAWLSKLQLGIGGEQVLYVDVRSNFIGNLYYTSDSGISSTRINGPGRYSFRFKPDEVGINNLYVFTDSGGAKELSFWVTEKVNLSIEKFDVPEFIAKGVETRINATIRNNGPAAKNVRLTLTAGDYSQAEQISLSGEKNLTFDIVLNETGENKVTLSLETPEFNDEVAEPVTVYSPPSIDISKISFYLENDKAMAEFLFSVAGEAKDVSLAVDNKLTPFSNRVALQLDPGSHFIEIGYYDVANNSYLTTKSIKVPTISELRENASLFNILRSALSSEGTVKLLIIIVPLLLIVIFVVVFKKMKKGSSSNSSNL